MLSRATAWKVAAALKWDDTTAAEHLVVASLQADALITEDRDLVAAATGIVSVGPVEDLFR